MNNDLRRYGPKLRQRFSIRTTILELVRAFNEQTKDDGLVVAAVSQLLSSGRVRSVRSLRPLTVIATADEPYVRMSQPRPREQFSGCAGSLS